MGFPRLVRQPRTRQAQHIEAMVAHMLDGKGHKKGLFSHGMGSGKTQEAIAVTEELAHQLTGKHGRKAHKNRFNVAISMPATIIEKWIAEIGKVLTAGTFRVVPCLDAASAFEVIADMERTDVKGITFYLFPDTMVRRHFSTTRLPLVGMARNKRTAMLLDMQACQRPPKGAKVLSKDDLETLGSGTTRKKKGATGILPDGNKNKKTEFGKLARCPECGELPLWKKVGADGEWRYLTQEEAKNDRSTECPLCGKSWMVNVTASTKNVEIDDSEESESDEKPHMLARAVSPAYVFKKMRGKGDHKVFDLFICDEVHRAKGKGIHNKSTSWMMNASKRVLTLTGTLTGGRARDLHRLSYMLNPAKCRKLGITWDSEKSFTDRYGAHVTRFTTMPDGTVVKTRENVVGTAANWYTDIVAELATFMYTEEQVADGDITLPELKEKVVLVDMVNPDMVEAYERMEQGIRKALASIPTSHASRNGRQQCAINLLNSWPDSLAFNTFEYASGDLSQVLEFDNLDVDITDKEEKLVEILRKEISEGRKSLVLTNFSDCGPRLLKVLTAEGINAVQLTSKVPGIRREEWLENALAAGADVVITNPELVKEGLDLVSFQNIISYQATLNVYTWLQSLRRLYRPGQTQEVHHYFMAYARTAQEITSRLVADKVNSALMAEGNMADTAILDLADKSSADSIMRQLIQAVLESDPTLQYRSVTSAVKPDDSNESTEESKIVSITVDGIPIPLRVITRPASITFRKRSIKGLYHPDQLMLFAFVTDGAQAADGIEQQVAVGGDV